MQTKKLSNILLILSLVILIFGSGYKLGEYKILNSSIKGNNVNFNNTSNTKNIDFKLFWDAWNQLDQKYVDKKKLDPQKMFYGAIKGMVASVDDPYTFFMSPNENKQSKDDLGGKFEGIGAQLGMKDNQIVIIAPLKKSPAEAAGVKAGDQIIKVDNIAIKGQTLPEVVSKIRGTKDTKVTLSLNRSGKDFDITITRDQILITSVELSYETKLNCGNQCTKVAYLKLNQFGDTTNDEWDKAIDEITTKWNNKDIKGMIVDVRDNPGGYLESAVYLASEFVPENTVIVKQESTTTPSKTYVSLRTGKLVDIPLVFIINKGSASASEILAGAMRDNKKATLVGEKSFGKGSVQDALDLQGGAGLHVTVAKWILPNGDWINGKGIEPEVKIENVVKEGNTLTRQDDVQLEKAIDQVLK
ncbi:MAG: S41 family peptidase [bacterium]|nr:S41 family peptidase [bacterium]